MNAARIDAEHARAAFAIRLAGPDSAGVCPRGARRAGSAAEIEDRLDPRRRARQLFDDMCQQEMVEWAIEERECRALAGARQRRALGELLPPLHVGGRERPKGA